MVTKPIRFLKLLSGLFLFCITLPIMSQQNRNIPEMNFMQFEPYLHFSNDTTYIINFWATWCVPCRKEVPDLEKIHRDFTGKKVKVVLVSLDFPKTLENSLIPFLEKNSITAIVILLNDPNSNAWIDKVDSSWSGALPATLIYKGNTRNFYEKTLDYETIKNTISEIF